MPLTRVTFITAASVLTAYLAYGLFHPPILAPPQQRLADLSFGSQPSNPHDPITLRNFSRRIVAVGDLHGDYPNALKVLKMTDVVDDDGNWTGKVDWFVQTGDIIDRGDDTIKLFTWMDQLRAQADAAGGTVVSLLGNHEWMNVIGDWRYVYDSEIKTFGSITDRQAVLTTGPIGQSWLRNYTTTARVPLHPSLGAINSPFSPSSPLSPFSHSALSFVHGGLAPGYVSLVPYPTRINDVARSLLTRLIARDPQPRPYPQNRNGFPGLPPDATPEEHELYASAGPVWYRGWALSDEQRVCADVAGVMGAIGVRRLIMGHTPDFKHIVSRCNGSIIIIDTGISHAYGGTLSALNIDYSVTRAENEASEWTEREVVKAVYLDRDDVLVDEQRVIVDPRNP